MFVFIQLPFSPAQSILITDRNFHILSAIYHQFQSEPVAYFPITLNMRCNVQKVLLSTSIFSEAKEFYLENNTWEPPQIYLEKYSTKNLYHLEITVKKTTVCVNQQVLEQSLICRIERYPWNICNAGYKLERWSWI